MDKIIRNVKKMKNGERFFLKKILTVETKTKKKREKLKIHVSGGKQF